MWEDWVTGTDFGCAATDSIVGMHVDLVDTLLGSKQPFLCIVVLVGFGGTLHCLNFCGNLWQTCVCACTHQVHASHCRRLCMCVCI